MNHKMFKMLNCYLHKVSQMLSENVRMALLVIDDWEVLTAEVLMGFIYSKDTTEQSICFDATGFLKICFLIFGIFFPSVVPHRTIS